MPTIAEPVRITSDSVSTSKLMLYPKMMKKNVRNKKDVSAVIDLMRCSISFIFSAEARLDNLPFIMRLLLFSTIPNTSTISSAGMCIISPALYTNANMANIRKNRSSIVMRVSIYSSSKEARVDIMMANSRLPPKIESECKLITLSMSM